MLNMKGFNSEKILLALAQLNLLQLQTAFEWDRQNSWVKRGRDGRFGSGDSAIVSAPKDRITDNARVRESLVKVVIDPDEAAIAIQRLESRPKDYNPAYNMFLLPLQREYIASKNLKQQDLERFQQRIKEIDRIVGKGYWENNRDLAWRVGAIKAEINYGDLIDELTDIDLPKDEKPGLKPLLDLFADRTAYKKLFKRLEKGTETSGIQQATPEQSKAIQDFIRKGIDKIPTKDRMVGLIEIPEDLRDGLVKAAMKPGAEFQKLVYPKLEVILDAFTDRGFTLDSNVIVEQAKKERILLDPVFQKEFRYINVGNYKGVAVKFVMNHEEGHQLEKKLEQVETSKRFIDARATSPFLMDLKNYGMPGEKVVQDSFSHPYTGKVYTGAGANATEVVSTATQALASPIALSTQSYLDREHIMYGLSVMDMKEGDRFPGGED